jgi:hypothetical protein
MRATPNIVIPSSSAERSSKITELRALLAEKFPQQKAKSSDGLPTGLPQIQLQRGIVTEVYGSMGCGTLFLGNVIQTVCEAHSMVALVDGASAFDPEVDNQRLLWVLCKEAQSAIKVTDLLLRDGNLPLVLLDLQMNPAAELRRIPSTTWYRFQRIVEQSTSAFVVLTQRPIVSSAATRVQLRNRWTLRSMVKRRADLLLDVEAAHRRIFSEPTQDMVPFADGERQIA